MSRVRLNSHASHPHHLLHHARQSSSTSAGARDSHAFSSNLADAEIESPFPLHASGTSTGGTATTPGVASSAAAPVPIPNVSPAAVAGAPGRTSLSISPGQQVHPHPHSAGGLYAHQLPRPVSRSPTTPAHAAGLTYFYRHNRQGSNTSLDSSSHFIDHRQQPHSLSLNPHSPVLNRRPSSSIQQQHVRSPVAFRRGFFDAGSAAATPTEATDGRLPPESPHDVSMVAAAAYHTSPSGAALDALVGDPPVSVGGHRRLSGGQRSAHSGRSGRDGQDGIAPGPAQTTIYGDRGSPHTISRRTSMLEDDVCFPMMPNTADNNTHSLAYHDEHPEPGPVYSHDHPHQEYHPHGVGEGEEAYRLPPGYPFTFDMQILEEFAAGERERVQTVALSDSYQPVLDGSAQQQQGAVPISTTSAGGLRNRMGRPSMEAASSGAHLYGASPDSDDATFYMRKPKKISSAVPGNHVAGVFNTYHQSRASPRLQGGDSNVNLQATLKDHAKAKTPLLDAKSGMPSYGTEGDARSTKSAKAAMARSQSHVAMSAAAQDSVFQRGRSGSTPGGGSLPTGAALYAAQQLQTERPYRFTFYSNTLPSTIHARYLSEIPAPGQTFEELLSGRKPTSPVPTPPEGVAPGSSIPATGLDGSTAVGPSNTNGSGSGHAAGTDPVLSRPSSVLPNAQGMPLPLPAHLLQQAGRIEGNTAPPTGANTPLMAQHTLPPASGKAPGALGLNTSMSGTPTAAGSRAGGAGPAGAPGAGRVASANLAANVGRTYPGGGLRMDQDADANTWWLDVLCPTDAEMKLLSRAFGVHPLTTEDILMEETREKIELFRNYFLVCFRSFDQDPHSPSYLEPVNMYIIVFREGTLSFHFHPTPHPQNVRRRIKQLKDYISVTSDWISYALIDDITDAFGPLIQNIEYEVDSIDELVLILKDVEQSDMLRRIGTCRKKVMGLLRLMGNKADVVKGLAKRCNENWSVAPKSDIGLYLSDIQDHLITMTQNLNHYEKILSRSHSNYLAQISIEMTDANNQINDVLSKLTALGTIIVPMNVITGLWGMNVNVPGQGVENLHWFAGICAVLAFFAVSGYYATIRYLQR